MPVLRQPARPRGAHLPAGERVPALSEGPAPAPGQAELLELLAFGRLEVLGRITDASNATLYATVTLDGATVPCVYKPVAGERPLWDFPARTLARREVAAYRLSAAAGWDVVPPTVLRDGPSGPGSVQWWVGEPEEIPEPGGGLIDIVEPGRLPEGWLRVLDAEGPAGRPVVLAHADDPTLARMAVFDAVANNTDRKGGHVLRHAGGALYGVDHGLTFNLDDKLRTVLWGFRGRPLGDEELARLTRVETDLAGDTRLFDDLCELLDADEVARTAERARRLVRRGRYPRQPGDWPAIPWPPF
ncbi:SCO1664 family protein [Spongisporangium articulatum]|uniref:SCO1664 family protein n=1 Tax=Spongisporangium articulatum TaxID=3362603 RepID=A0ABW8ARX1_9ACTN